MARYDKYDSKMSGTRSFLAADWPATDLEKVVGVGLNAAGQLVRGAGQTGIIGVLVLTRVIKAGREPVDLMKRGEIVEFDTTGRERVANAAAVPGTAFYSTPTGDIVADAAAGANTYVGHTVEAGRLVVSMGV